MDRRHNNPEPLCIAMDRFGFWPTSLLSSLRDPVLLEDRTNIDMNLRGNAFVLEMPVGLRYYGVLRSATK